MKALWDNVAEEFLIPCGFINMYCLPLSYKVASAAIDPHPIRLTSLLLRRLSFCSSYPVQGLYAL